MAEKKVEVGHKLEFSDSPSALRYRRSSLSIAHVLSAFVLAKQTREVEEKAKSSGWKGQHDEQRAFATATVVMAAAFLEALANELVDCLRDDGRAGVFAPFSTREVQEARARHGRPTPTATKSKIIAGYHQLLAAFKKAPPTPTADSSLDAELIVELRNNLMHASPVDSVFSSSGAVTIASLHESLERSLGDLTKRRRIEINPLWPDAVLFPNGILGAGLARWAATAALDYADGFFRELGVPALYEHVRPQLS